MIFYYRFKNWIHQINIFGAWLRGHKSGWKACNENWEHHLNKIITEPHFHSAMVDQLNAAIKALKARRR